ncbi:MAG TPA: signal peptidase I [Chloroflexia bacterium]|nr:signal peptidase I [Chloroflexia bacterium]
MNKDYNHNEPYNPNNYQYPVAPYQSYYLPPEELPVHNVRVEINQEKPRRNWFQTLMRYALVWLGVFLLVKFIIPSYDVQGASMEPTYQVSGDRVLTDQVFFKVFDDINRGDIVVINDKSVSKDALIKRVIGLPGETIEIKQGTVYINGAALDEPYIKFKAHYNYPATKVPPDSYFVLGDNRPVSLDSHYFGPVTKDQIVAKVLLTYPWHP